MNAKAVPSEPVDPLARLRAILAASSVTERVIFVALAATALVSLRWQLGSIVGPAIGALILTVAPTWVAFAVNGFTFILSGILISTLRPRPGPAPPG